MCFFIFFSKDWKPTTFVTMFQAVPKKKRTKENKMKKNEKEKTITKKEKKFRSVGICTTYYSSVTKRREIQRFYTSFINTTKYDHISLSYISHLTSTASVLTYRQFLRVSTYCPRKKRKKVRPRSTKLTIITKQYVHRTRTAQRPPAGSCQVLHLRQKKLD